MANIPILLLAAGGSKRMGRPKHLLPWGDHTLIEHQIQTLRKTGTQVNVVLGAHANLIIPVVEKYDVNIFMNNNWKDGMGSSIATGINGLKQENPGTDGILIALVDQPLIPPEHFLKMLKTFQPEKKQIIASQSPSGWHGVPVLFDKSYFEELQNLTGKEGAKKITHKHQRVVKYVECGNFLEDMDTPEKYRQLLKKYISQF